MAMPTAKGQGRAGRCGGIFPARVNACPHAVNDARWRGSKTPAEWSEAKAASDNGPWWHSAVESLETKFSAIHHLPLSENGARRAGGRKADFCPARIGGGLPPACCAECAAVA